MIFFAWDGFVGNQLEVKTTCPRCNVSSEYQYDTGKIYSSIPVVADSYIDIHGWLIAGT